MPGQQGLASCRPSLPGLLGQPPPPAPLRSLLPPLPPPPVSPAPRTPLCPQEPPHQPLSLKRYQVGDLSLRGPGGEHPEPHCSPRHPQLRPQPQPPRPWVRRSRLRTGSLTLRSSGADACRSWSPRSLTDVARPAPTVILPPSASSLHPHQGVVTPRPETEAAAPHSQVERGPGPWLTPAPQSWPAVGTLSQARLLVLPRSPGWQRCGPQESCLLPS